MGTRLPGVKNALKLFVFAMLITNSVQSQTLQRVWLVPRAGTFYGEYIEHATFAPVDLPPIQLQ
jgi:hypothetical protein